jgi:aminoglycoside phosphotransferase (APT) family kinase protein
MGAVPTDLHHRCRDLIVDLGLGQPADVTEVVPLTGGVASDIARVRVAGRDYCVKFALARLRVAAEWFAPPHRSRAEYAWLEVAGQAAPRAVPALFGYSDRLQGFAMEYLAGQEVRLWKASLLAGTPPRDEAARVASVLGRIHATGAAPGFDRSRFDNAADFHAIRVEPYLLFTAQRHPAVAGRLAGLAAGLDRAAITLVHGDVSPKNILLRGQGPVLLDAECATMGDPAFDVAFCLNHLILKSLHLPALRTRLRAAVPAFWRAYRPHVAWEPPAAVEARVAALLPALMLARVDGKSPVEYLSDADRARVRALSLPLIADPVPGLGALLHRLDAGDPAR